MSLALVRPASSIAWELRSAWALGLRISVTLDADEPRLEGFVKAVAATGVYCVVSGTHVPLDRVLAVHRPSRLGDSTVAEDERWAGSKPLALRQAPGQLRLESS